MKSWFTWLLVFGVIAGSLTRVVALDPCDSLLEQHAEEHSHHDHDSHQPCDPKHDSNCPVEHHQHGGCCHTLPMVVDPQNRVLSGAMNFSFSPWLRESTLAPDEPVQDLDKPPLV